LASLPTGAAAGHDKTDLVFLANGDRFTGEIKRLDHGILSLSTNAAGTLSIEWEDIDSLYSVYEFRVEDSEGGKQFGTLALSRDDTLQVSQPQHVVNVPQVNAVVITPLEASLWEQLDGSISAGVSYTKSNSLLQLNYNVNVRRQTTLRQLELDASSITTSQEQSDPQRREDLTLTYDRLFKGRWFATTSASVQSNDELGLDLRVQLAPGLGLNLIRTNSSELVTTAGLSGNREWSASGGTYNLEAFASVSHSMFRYDSPKLSLSEDFAVYPSLSNSGRVRLELDIDASHEIMKDFTVTLSFYDSYDNDPPNPTAATNDYGLVASMGWTF